MAKDYVGEMREAALQRIVDLKSDRFGEGADTLPSPLEQAFFFALCATADHRVMDHCWAYSSSYIVQSFERGQVVARLTNGRDFDTGGTEVVDAYSGRDLHVYPQVKVGRCTVDFILELKGEDFNTFLVVECDGHDFHEKTKEQARRDKARDRAIQAAGLPVFRFAGSEIYADAQKCARTCLEYLEAENTRRSDDKFAAALANYEARQVAGAPAVGDAAKDKAAGF